MPATNVEEMIRKAEKARRDKMIADAEASRLGPGGAAGLSAGKSLIDIVGDPGELVAGTLAGLSAGAQELVEGATRFAGNRLGFDLPDRATFSERFEEEKGKLPAAAFDALPSVDTADLGGAAEAFKALLPGGETPGDAFERGQNEIDLLFESIDEQHPLASTLGDVGGEALFLGGGRSVAGIPTKMRRLEQTILGSRFNISRIPEGSSRRLFAEYANSPGLRNLIKGAGRTLETGAEAAILEIADGDDPLEAFGYAAGIQAANSGLLTAFGDVTGKGSFGSKGLRIAAAAFSVAALIEVGEEFIPGADDSFIDEIETGFGKVALGLVVGVGAATFGGRGRGNANLERNATEVADFFAALPRGGMLSIMSDSVGMNPEEKQRITSALQVIGENADRFSDEDLSAIEDSISNGTFVRDLDALVQLPVTPPRLQ